MLLKRSLPRIDLTNLDEKYTEIVIIGHGIKRGSGDGGDRARKKSHPVVQYGADPCTLPIDLPLSMRRFSCREK